MSIARALTVRLRRHIDSSAPSSPLPTEQSGMMKRMGSVIDRSKISSPVELISTTNMLSYNAPDVATIQQLRDASSSSSSVTSSSAASDAGSDDNARSSTDLTDASSVDASPSPCEPEPNHLSCYFASALDSSSRSASPARAKSPAAADPLAPAIPQRALSHSKSSHMALARQRSLRSVSTASSMHSSGLSRSSSLREQRASVDMFKSGAGSGSAVVEPNHPFGKELEKLSEVVEELGGVMRDAENEDDGVVMREQGLCKWSADDYLVELQPLYCMDFSGSNHPASMIPAWI